ncbi:MAG: S-layer glycoprotein N-glycosyltransferase AglJ [Halobacteria archaeon]|nr:S-layer glycoprotein N-glycosyltransferase AglJ [Halobacteria archaeon]
MKDPESLGDTKVRDVSKDEVCVLIPTLNEEGAIGEVIEGFSGLGFDNILVIDGGSDDTTREIAREKGARVVVQSGKGKGQAVQEAINLIDEPYVVMVDGDGTYDPDEVDRLLEPLERGYDHVLGNRLSDPDEGAFTRLNYAGNRIFNSVFSLAHGRDLSDILTGYRAFTTQSAEDLYLEEKGFGIETEMTVESLKHDQDVVSVPISYRSRPETADTKLHPIKDGARIAYTIYRMTKTNNPLFYFGSIGGLLFLMGFVSGLYVVYDRYVNGISRNLLAVLTALLVLAGVQLFIFGSLSDILVDLHREEMREIRSLKEEDDE